MEEELEKDMTPRLIGETYLKKATITSRYRSQHGIFECQYCRKVFEASAYQVRVGLTKSCGCQRGSKPVHGLSNHRFYATWADILQRCNNPQRKTYKHYGGRGITVCDEWLDIKNFVAWAEATHPNIEGVSLDRVNNDKGYSPENCRWVDVTTQILNQRKRKDNTSGFVGVCWDKRIARWVALIGVASKDIKIGQFDSIEEAVQARDNYIIENKLPHKLSTEY